MGNEVVRLPSNWASEEEGTHLQGALSYSRMGERTMKEKFKVKTLEKKKRAIQILALIAKMGESTLKYVTSEGGGAEK